jgi:ubiquinone/menaquinone biosynthesis C-methylase UbiE
MNTSTKNNFNSIAPVYDRLAKLIFGRCIQSSQIHFLNNIIPQSSILVVGGGTGWFLKALLATANCKKIVYVDSSSKMIELSKKNIEKMDHSCEVVFINSSIEEAHLENLFDVVITNFFLDLFEEQSLKLIMLKLHNSLSKEGIWMISDFKKSPTPIYMFWQNLLMKLTFVFFKIFSNIENSKLLNLEKYFSEIGMSKVNSKYFFYKMIESAVYKNKQEIQ